LLILKFNEDKHKNQKKNFFFDLKNQLIYVNIDVLEHTVLMPKVRSVDFEHVLIY